MAMLFLFGCKEQTKLQFAMTEAGDNREVLQSVLDHYKGDSLKYAAAVFLIESMPYHYGLEGEELDNLYRFYYAASKSELSPQKVSDSLRLKGVQFSYNRLKVVPDITNISADFLIDHIGAAFDIWKTQPWGKHIDFDTFCHHILPYRVGNEKLRPWLREMHRRFNPLLDSIRTTPDSANIRKVTETLITRLQKMRKNYGHGLPSGVTIGPDNTEWFAGDCREFADIQTYIMRAVGLPGGCDKMPMNGNYFLPHFWNYVIDEKRDTHYCSILFRTPNTVPATQYPGPKGKVMREKFEINDEYAKRQEAYTNLKMVHPDFRYFTDEDVTRLYSGDSIQTVTVSLAECYDNPVRDEIVYACLSTRLDWAPVDVAIKKSNGMVIQDLDGDVVMRLGVYRDNRMHYISNPFNVCKKDGRVRFYNPQTQQEEVCLMYKFDDIFRERFSVGMVGGVMEGSNYPDFREGHPAYDTECPCEIIHKGQITQW